VVVVRGMVKKAKPRPLLLNSDLAGQNYNIIR
jgi:hypothetical protein